MGLMPGIRRRTSRPHFINMIDKNLTKAHVDYIGVAPRREFGTQKSAINPWLRSIAVLIK